jgi:hypothetical protein
MTRNLFSAATFKKIARPHLEPSIGVFNRTAGYSGGVMPCLHRVVRVVLTLGQPLPVYPDKQTYSDPVGMSQTCQWATSFYHLVGLARSAPAQ